MALALGSLGVCEGCENEIRDTKDRGSTMY